MPSAIARRGLTLASLLSSSRAWSTGSTTSARGSRRRSILRPDRGSSRRSHIDRFNVKTATSERPRLAETAALVRRLWRGYDLAVSTQAGDRPTFFGLIAARRRVGLVPRAGQTGAWWKRYAHHIPVAAEPDCHRVTQLWGLA